MRFLSQIALSVWAFVLCVALPVGSALAADGVWQSTVDGQRWGTALNWESGNIANGSGSTAFFNAVDLVDDTRVHVDSARSLGHLVFGDIETVTAAGWVLDDFGYRQNTLTLSGSGPSITVHALGAGKSASLHLAVAGNSGIQKEGSGSLVLTRSMTYTGQTILNAGALVFEGNHVLAANQALQVNAGSVLELDVFKQYINTLSSADVGEGNGGVISGAGGLLTVYTPGTTSFGGFFEGVLNITRTGTRTLTLTSSNATAGAVSVIGGMSSLRERNVDSDRGYGLTLLDGGAFPHISDLTVRNATLDLDNHSGSRDLADRIHDAAPITLDNGTIRFVGRLGRDSTETLGPVTVSGFSSITMLVAGNGQSQAGTHSAELTLASLTRTPGAMVQFNRATGVHTPLGQAGNNRPRVFLSDTNGLKFVNHIVVGMSIYNDNDKYHPVSYVPGLGFGSAVKNQPGFPNNFLPSADGNGFTGKNTLETAAATNDFATGASQRVKLGGQTINSLGIQGGGFGASNIPLTFQNTNDTLTIATGWLAMWFQQTQIGETTNRGAITSGHSELFMLGGYQGAWGDAGNVNRIHSVIKDNGVEPVMFSMNLGRHTYLSAHNTYSGGTIVNGMLAREAGSVFRNNLFLSGDPGTVTIPNAADPRKGLVITGADVVMEVNGGQIGSSNIVTLNGASTLRLVDDNTLAGLVFNGNGGNPAPTLSPVGVLTLTGEIESTPFDASFTSIINGGVLDFSGATTHVSVASLPEGVYVNGLGPMVGLSISSIIQNGGLSKTGDGVLSLTGNNTFAGQLSVESGVLCVGGVNGEDAVGPLGKSFLPVILGTDTLSATLAYIGGSASSTKRFSLPAIGTFLVDDPAVALTLNGVIDGVALTKAGPGTLVLGAVNTYTGPTIVNGGSLNISSDANLGAVPPIYLPDAITLNNSATLALTADVALDAKRGIVLGIEGIQTITGIGGSAVPLPGGVSGAGGVAFNGNPGQLSLGHTNTYTGETRVLGAARLIEGGERAFQFSTVTDAPGTSIFAYSGPGSAVLGGLAGDFDFPLETVSGTPHAVALSVGNNNQNTSYRGQLSGAGTLTKRGSGTLTLSGNNSYTGATTVTMGTLVGVTGGSCSLSPMRVENGAAHGIRILDEADTWSCARLSYAAGTTSAKFEFDAPLSSVSAPLQVNGDLEFEGTVNVIVGPPTRIISAGSYPLVSYSGALIGSPPTVPNTLPPGMVATLTNNISNKSIDLLVSVGNEVTWSVGDGEWDIATSTNWTDPNSALLTYIDGEGVRFDDSPAGGSPLTVTLNTAVNPLRILIDNTTRNYVLTGSGSIGGATTTLIKQGAGTFSLEIATTFAGGSTLLDGTLALAGLGSLSHSGALVLDGGTLDIGGVSDSVGRLTLLRGNILGAGGTLSASSYTVQNVGDTAYVSAILGGAGSLQKSGSGTLLLSATNSYSGPTTISGGVLSVAVLADGGNNSSIGRAASSADNLILAGGVLRYTGGTTSMDRDFTLSDATISGIDVEHADSILILTGAGAISDGGLVKSGSGTLVFAGNNAYSGSTTVAGGILQIGNGAASGRPGTGAIINNAVLVFDRSDNAYQQIAPVLGSGSLIMRGSGTVTLSGSNTYAGITFVEAGSLKLSGPVLPMTTTLRIEPGADLTLDFDGVNDIGYLFFNGESQARGTWGTTGSGAQYTNDTFLSDRGILNVRSTFFHDGIMLLLR